MPGFKCKKCGKSFKSEQALKIHVGLMHSAKKRKKRRAAKRVKAAKRSGVTCQVCGRRFKLPLHLGRHMAAAHGKAGKRGAGPGRRKMVAGLNVSSLTIDQLLDLKRAMDDRLKAVARRMRTAGLKA